VGARRRGRRMKEAGGWKKEETGEEEAAHGD
jgi:hypothetical protein